MAAAVDALAESYQRRGGQPGIAYGVVAGGRLVHAGGFGQRAGLGARQAAALWPGGGAGASASAAGPAEAGPRRTPGRSSVSRR